jgi:hypothetical protein
MEALKNMANLLPKNKQRCPCPIHGCRSQRRRDQVMCAGHWFKVPRELRDEIWRLCRSEAGSAAHLTAIRDAIRSVNEQVAELAPTSPAA